MRRTGVGTIAALDVGPKAQAWIGEPDEQQQPLNAASLPSVYWTSSGWGIRVDQPATPHSSMGTEGACISMPPEHWRATVLRILHLTESHDPDDGGPCPACDRIAAAIDGV